MAIIPWGMLPMIVINEKNKISLSLKKIPGLLFFNSDMVWVMYAIRTRIRATRKTKELINRNIPDFPVERGILDNACCANMISRISKTI
ncbi:hypothetical protein WKV44_01825 [Spirochaetia bacterium 38H-sp]|uniref:Uncharacterized protein n=1 Tax=Rarispira pelagica TaxID=3141764 RepID=A0ABU9U9D1_9SPIR